MSLISMFALITKGDTIFILKIATLILTYKHPNFLSLYYL